MKVFHNDKYNYVGLQQFEGAMYYAFKSIKMDFKPEIVLVREARVTMGNGVSKYYDESQLKFLENKLKRIEDGQEVRLFV